MERRDGGEVQGQIYGTRYKAVVINQAILTSGEMGTLIMPILQMSNLRLREVDLPQVSC